MDRNRVKRQLGYIIRGRPGFRLIIETSTRTYLQI